MLGRWLRQPGSQATAWRADVLVAVLATALLVVVRAAETGGDAERRLGSLVLLLTLAAGLSLAGAHRHPRAVFAVTLALALVVIALDDGSGAISLPVVAMVCLLAQDLDRRAAALAAVGAALALMLVRGLLQSHGWSDGRTVAEPAVVLAALFLGWAVRNQRAYVEEIEQRAARAERTREEEARRRVDAERLRIARELHDVVAHSISTISIQAGVAAHVIDEQPERAADALQAIKATSREVLRELRAILGVLRTVDDGDERRPAAGLDQLDALLLTTASAGLPAQVEISGARRPLPAAVDLAAYRILQESLTNVLRHGGDTTARVAITFEDERITITVEDDGRREARRAPAGAGADGHGIAGMRERAHALGGDLEAGPRVEGGFRVRARLPVSGAA